MGSQVLPGANQDPARAPVGHYPGGDPPGPGAFRRALDDVSEALATSDLRAVVMGGVGSASIARPRPTDDIDLFVHPEDVEALLEHLSARGFDTVRVDPTWLHKAYRHGVLIDVIFRSSGDIYLDEEMIERATPRSFQGSVLPMLAPEDLVVIKAVAAVEHAPHHWYDALGVIARCDLDWPYLIHRSRRFAPRRMLSLLLYAESNDLAVPSSAIDELHHVLHPGVVPHECTHVA